MLWTQKNGMMIGSWMADRRQKPVRHVVEIGPKLLMFVEYAALNWSKKTRKEKTMATIKDRIDKHLNNTFTNNLCEYLTGEFPGVKFESRFDFLGSMRKFTTWDTKNKSMCNKIKAVAKANAAAEEFFKIFDGIDGAIKIADKHVLSKSEYAKKHCGYGLVSDEIDDHTSVWGSAGPDCLTVRREAAI